ncbi:unnamed protein product [Prunus brigantina]
MPTRVLLCALISFRIFSCARACAVFVVSASCCVSAAIMGDASKVVARSSAFETNEERPSRDYATPITSENLDGSNYASWSRGACLTFNGCRMANWINWNKPALSPDSATYAKWEEDNCLV